MKNATEFAKKFKTFRRKLPAIEAVTTVDGVIEELIFSHLLWNATFKQANAAFHTLIDATVDLNELRVNHVNEIIELIGDNYPQAQERTKRLRAVLNAIYMREHNVSVACLEGVGKREIREYFETLNGMTPFVCNRVIALCYGVAAIPVDERTLSALIAQNIVHEDANVAESASWLVRQVKAAEIADVHIRLHSWAAAQPFRVAKPAKKRVTKKPTIKKTEAKKRVTKKPTIKKTEAKKTTTKKVEAKKATTKKTVAVKATSKKTSKKPTVKKKTSSKKKVVTKKTVTKKKITKKKVTKKKVTKKKTKK